MAKDMKAWPTTDCGQPLIEEAPDDGREETPRQEQARQKRNEKRQAEYAGMSTQQKTQYAADLRFKDGANLYRCFHQIVKVNARGQKEIKQDSVWPEVTLRADSMGDAILRYKALGINSTEHEIVAELQGPAKVS